VDVPLEVRGVPTSVSGTSVQKAERLKPAAGSFSAVLDGGREELLWKPRFWMLAHQLLKLRCIGPGMKPGEITRDHEPPRLRLGVHMGPR
jgi:hypothetical protein